MEKLKQILFKILFLHSAFISIFVLIAILLMSYVAILNDVNPVIKYITYFLSAYSLVLVGIKVPAVIKKIKMIKQENKYLNQYFSNVNLRIKMSLYGSLIINIFYAIMQFILGYLNQSIWFYSLSGYYFLLAFMRLFLLSGTQKNNLGENQYVEYLNYRFCGVILLLMNIILSLIMFYIVKQNKGFFYHDIITIAMAAYTFTIFTITIVNLVRYRKYHSPIISASKNINLIAAFVSMLSLETAMLNAFGKNDLLFRKIMTASSGGIVCIIVLIIAIYMIVHANKQLKENVRNERKPI